MAMNRFLRFHIGFIEQNNLSLMISRCYDAKEGFLMTNWGGDQLTAPGGRWQKSSEHIIAQLDPQAHRV
jgi:hypothetical protein